MGRSVSYAKGSIAIAYSYFESENEFDFVIENMQQHAMSIWTSLSACDKWLGREDHAVLENAHCYMGLSEYCGLVSYWIVPKEDNNLSKAWCNSIANKFKSAFGTINKVGTFSNGEAVFERKVK